MSIFDKFKKPLPGFLNVPPEARDTTKPITSGVNSPATSATLPPVPTPPPGLAVAPPPTNDGYTNAVLAAGLENIYNQNEETKNLLFKALEEVNNNVVLVAQNQISMDKKLNELSEPDPETKKK